MSRRAKPIGRGTVPHSCRIFLYYYIYYMWLLSITPKGWGVNNTVLYMWLLSIAPEGWDMNNTVQAEGAVRWLSAADWCVPIGTRHTGRLIEPAYRYFIRINLAVFPLKSGAKIHHFFQITGFHHAAVCPWMFPNRPPTRIGMPPNPWCCVRGCAREACRTTGFPVCGQNNPFPLLSTNIGTMHC